MLREVRTPASLAFDRLAPDYDRLASGELFRHQRARTHDVLARWLAPRCRVLEIGCGTGLDTEFLARRGMEVVASDPSPAMLRRTLDRVVDAGLGSRVRVLDCGLQDLPPVLETLEAKGFDAIVSNFGALNCVEDLAPLGLLADRWLRPGGSVLACVMGRHCIWEMAYLALTDRAGAAHRRLERKARVAVAGIDVPTYYHSIVDLRQVLGSSVDLTHVFGIGVLAPPLYLEPRWQRTSPLLRAIVNGADRVAASWPLLNRCGDHELTRWAKRRDAGV